MKKSWTLRSDYGGVSPVIATILLVGVTVVLAATLYIMAFGFGAGTADTPPVANITKSSVENGLKFTFTPFSKDTTWNDISFVLTAEADSVSFVNITTEDMMSDSGTVTKNLGYRDLGNLSIFMNVTDLAGNGYVNQGDSFTLTAGGGTFSNAVTYEIYIMYDPIGAVIASLTFQG
ncbi:MAG: type IV pilin N-terminal domain-containing protein [Thermoplasmata archaeon]